MPLSPLSLLLLSMCVDRGVVFCDSENVFQVVVSAGLKGWGGGGEVVAINLLYTKSFHI
jgi:hypothetical protein